MSDEIQKTALRLPKSLHEAIHKAAKESGRTMNAEIVYRLQQSFDAKTHGELKQFNLSVENKRLNSSQALGEIMKIIASFNPADPYEDDALQYADQLSDVETNETDSEKLERQLYDDGYYDEDITPEQIAKIEEQFKIKKQK